MASAEDDTDEIYIDDADEGGESTYDEIDWDWSELEADLDDSLDDAEDSSYE
jgi:hypothetical protein